MSDTKPIAAVEPDVSLAPYSDSIKARFRKAIEGEIAEIQMQATRDINEISAKAAMEIRECQQVLSHVESTVPSPAPVLAIRAGRDPYTAPEWAQNTDTHLERMGELHDAQDAREGARR